MDEEFYPIENVDGIIYSYPKSSVSLMDHLKYKGHSRGDSKRPIKVQHIYES